MAGIFENFNNKDLLIEINHKNNKLDVIFKGVLLAEENKKVEYFINELRKKMVLSKIKEINIKFNELKYMNSSGLKIILHWLTKNEESDADQRYKVNIYYNKNISWQELSFSYIITLFPNTMID